MAMADQQLFVETDLIRQAQNGNSAAFGELYTRHLAAIQHYIQKRVGERCDAEDLTQTVFVKAWHALRDYQPSGAPFRAWLYRIAHNAIVDHYRTQRHTLLWDDLTWLVDPQETPEGHTLTRERQETVRKAVAGLRKNYQTVIDQRFLQEFDYGETAVALGQQINHVRVVQHRALEVLRRVLSQENALWLATAVTVMSLLLGGKIVLAAEQALPGDRLYAMRTWVEETSLFLADDADDVQLHTRFATQRLTALHTLYAQERRADMATAIAAAAAHIRAASAQLATVQAAKRTTVAAQFAAALQSQAATVQQLTLADAQSTTLLEPVLIALTTAQATLSDAAPVSPTPTPTVTPQATATRVLVPTALPPAAAIRSDVQVTVAQEQAAATATPLTVVIAPVAPSAEAITVKHEPQAGGHDAPLESTTATSDRPQPLGIDLPAAAHPLPAKPTGHGPDQTEARPANAYAENQEPNPNPTADQTMLATHHTHVESAVPSAPLQPALVAVEVTTEKGLRAEHEQPHDVAEVTPAALPEPPHAPTDQTEPTPHEHKDGPTH